MTMSNDQISAKLETLSEQALRDLLEDHPELRAMLGTLLTDLEDSTEAERNILDDVTAHLKPLFNAYALAGYLNS